MVDEQTTFVMASVLLGEWPNKTEAIFIGPNKTEAITKLVSKHQLNINTDPI